MKKFVRRLIILTVIAGATVGFYSFGEKHLWPPPDLTTLNAVGIIEAPEVNITSRISGRIAELDLVEGDSVKRGRVVCRIEDIDLRNQVEHAKADLELAKVNLADAERTEKRDRRLIEQAVIAQKEYDDAVTKVGQAQGRASPAPSPTFISIPISSPTPESSRP